MNSTMERGVVAMLKHLEWSRMARVKLLPGGITEGRCYVTGWDPISPRMVEFFNSEKK